MASVGDENLRLDDLSDRDIDGWVHLDDDDRADIARIRESYQQDRNYAMFFGYTDYE